MSVRQFFSINFYNLALQTRKTSGALTPARKFRELVRITIKEVFGKKILNVKMTREKLFGKKIYFSDYQHLKSLFEEIFLEEQYYFKSSKKNPQIIDCGSNIGASILYFKLLYPEAKILAFEPDGDTFLLLQQFVKDNNLNDIQIVQKALSDKKGQVDLFTMPDDPSSLSMSIFKDAFEVKHKENVHLKVDATVLSEYINEAVDLLKIDIEGAEYEVLEELDKTKKLSQIRQIIIEGHVFNKSMSLKVVSLLKILEKNNFNFMLSSPVGLPAKIDIGNWRYMVYAEKDDN